MSKPNWRSRRPTPTARVRKNSSRGTKSCAGTSTDFGSGSRNSKGYDPPVVSMRMKQIAAAVTPSTGTRSRMGTRGLPADVLEQSCKRIGIMAITFASIWSIAVFMNNVVHGFLHHMRMDMMGLDAVWPTPGNLIAGIGVVISAVMFFIAYRHRARPETLLRIGLVYEVVQAGLVAFLFNWKPVIDLGGVSWLCIIILAYPAIVPSTPRSTFVAAFIAASMDPLWLGLAALRGEPFNRDTFTLIWHFLPTYICVVLATVPSHIIVGLGRQVNRARGLGSYQLGELIGCRGM